MKTKAQKQSEASKRAEKREERTPKQQLARLNRKFGKNKGAQRERERLTKIMERDAISA